MKRPSRPNVTAAATAAVKRAWDLNVEDRLADLDQGRDKNYHLVLDIVITAIKTFDSSNRSHYRGLDIGCGVGDSTQILADLGFDALGIDVSSRSVSAARERWPGLRFITAAPQEVASKMLGAFNVVTFTMTLHCLPDLDSVLGAAHGLLCEGGYCIVTIPHPATYLQHKWYYSSLDFDYHQEATFYVPFRVNGGRLHRSKVPFYHRSVSRYVEAFLLSSFKIVSMVEPAVSDDAPLADVILFVLTV